MTYDCGDFAEEHGRRGEARRRGGLRRPPRGVAGRAAGCAASPSSTPSSGRPGPQPEFAEIRFAPSGSATLLMGTKNQGQGHETTFKQILHERLGLDPDGRPLHRRRHRPRGLRHGHMGSRSTVIGGTALWTAADKVIAKGRKIAAKLLEAAEADIVLRRRPLHGGGHGPGGDAQGGGARRVPARPAPARRRARPLRDRDVLAQAGHVAQRLPRLRGRGRSRHGRGRRSSATSIVDDVGTVINPLTLKGQIHGGVAQGVGQALMEQVVYDGESGQLLTASFMDYAMPRADDLPRHGHREQSGADQAQPAGRQGRGRGGHGRARCPW